MICCPYRRGVLHAVGSSRFLFAGRASAFRALGHVDDVVRGDVLSAGRPRWPRLVSSASGPILAAVCRLKHGLRLHAAGGHVLPPVVRRCLVGGRLGDDHLDTGIHKHLVGVVGKDRRR